MNLQNPDHEGMEGCGVEAHRPGRSLDGARPPYVGQTRFRLVEESPLVELADTVVPDAPSTGRGSAPPRGLHFLRRSTARHKSCIPGPSLGRGRRSPGVRPLVSTSIDVKSSSGENRDIGLGATSTQVCGVERGEGRLQVRARKPGCGQKIIPGCEQAVEIIQQSQAGFHRQVRCW